eukprot:Lankesteria_metandrocarpae@DN3678_c1_g1_i1.p1
MTKVFNCFVGLHDNSETLRKTRPKKIRSYLNDPFRRPTDQLRWYQSSSPAVGLISVVNNPIVLLDFTTFVEEKETSSRYGHPSSSYCFLGDTNFDNGSPFMKKNSNPLALIKHASRGNTSRIKRQASNATVTASHALPSSVAALQLFDSLNSFYNSRLLGVDEEILFNAVPQLRRQVEYVVMNCLKTEVPKSLQFHKSMFTHTSIRWPPPDAATIDTGRNEPVPVQTTQDVQVNGKDDNGNLLNVTNTTAASSTVPGTQNKLKQAFNFKAFSVGFSNNPSASASRNKVTQPYGVHDAGNVTATHNPVSALDSFAAFFEFVEVQIIEFLVPLWTEYRRDRLSELTKKLEQWNFSLDDLVKPRNRHMPDNYTAGNRHNGRFFDKDLHNYACFSQPIHDALCRAGSGKLLTRLDTGAEINRKYRQRQLAATAIGGKSMTPSSPMYFFSLIMTIGMRAALDVSEYNRRLKDKIHRSTALKEQSDQHTIGDEQLESSRCQHGVWY